MVAAVEAHRIYSHLPAGARWEALPSGHMPVYSMAPELTTMVHGFFTGVGLVPSPALPGLVLRLRPLGESDLMVDAFTSSMGRITALAKGGKRSKQRFFRGSS